MKNFMLTGMFLLLFLFLYNCSSEKNPTVPETNRSPFMQSLTGPTECQLNQTYTYEAVGYDPDGSSIAYHFGYYPVENFTEYTDEGWTLYVNSYEKVEKNITWNSTGEYMLCCYCKDQQGNESSHIRIGVLISEQPRVKHCSVPENYVYRISTFYLDRLNKEDLCQLSINFKRCGKR